MEVEGGGGSIWDIIPINGSEGVLISDREERLNFLFKNQNHQKLKNWRFSTPCTNLVESI